jgi:hypothetical protein
MPPLSAAARERPSRRVAMRAPSISRGRSSAEREVSRTSLGAISQLGDEQEVPCPPRCGYFPKWPFNRPPRHQNLGACANRGPPAFAPVILLGQSGSNLP